MLQNFLVALFMNYIMFNIWSYLNDNKIKFLKIKTIILLVIASFATIFNYFIVNSFFKIITITLFFSLIYKLLFRVNYKQSFVGTIICQFIFFISECIISLIMLLILHNDMNKFVENFFGSIIMNFSISILAYAISKIKIFKYIFKKINHSIDKIENEKIIFIAFLGLFVYNLLGLYVFNGYSSQLLLFICFITSFLSFILVYLFFKSKDEYYRLCDKYNSSLLSLKELENAITNHRIDNHENRNHLMTIRNMTTSKKVSSFIDSILNNKIEDDKRIMKETSIIPSGGLRGLIYSKLLLMVSKNIEYELDVSNSVRTVDLLEYDDSLMLDVCKIVGIFLDNAIEEVDTIDDKYIVIEMYIDNDNLNICICNSYDSNKDISNIYTPGVSTKGKNHGYGLSLVKKIVKYNKKLEIYNEVTDEEFSQTLIIKK